jgi:nucleoside-diphosphate-sugar epimerase
VETAAFRQDVSAAHRLLITGASGFVGRALGELLHNDSRFEIIGAVRGSEKVAASSKHVVVGDINGATDWTAALTGVRTVVHLAARVHVMHETAVNPLADFRRVNVEGTRALAEQAAQCGVQRLIFLSSIKVHGESGTFTERDAPEPTDAYGVSKLEAEAALNGVAAATGLEVVIVRPPLVYGPGVKANFRQLLNLVQRGLPLPLGAIHNKRSFVAVQNLAHFLVRCAEHPQAANETFLISDGDDLSTPELIRRMARALGKPARLVPVPVGLLKLGAIAAGQRGAAERLLGSLQVDITKARELLGWTPAITVDQALQKVVAQ